MAKEKAPRNNCTRKMLEILSDLYASKATMLLYSPMGKQGGKLVIVVFLATELFTQRKLNICFYHSVQISHSGKTYTINGEPETETKGINNYVAQGIFQSSPTTVSVSCLEVYNEELIDMLSDAPSTLSHAPNHKSFSRNKGRHVQILEDGDGKIHMPNLTKIEVKDVNPLLKVIHKANKNRTTDSTTMNKKSSRSHFITIVSVERTHNRFSDGKEKECDNDKGNKEVVTTHGTLYLVDLAGS